MKSTKEQFVTTVVFDRDLLTRLDRKRIQVRQTTGDYPTRSKIIRDLVDAHLGQKTTKKVTK